MSCGSLTYRDIPSLKDDAIEKLLTMVTHPVKERYFSVAPVVPVESAQMMADEIQNDVTSD